MGVYIGKPKIFRREFVDKIVYGSGGRVWRVVLHFCTYCKRNTTLRKLDPFPFSGGNVEKHLLCWVRKKELNKA
jgi:hypothetical protein